MTKDELKFIKLVPKDGGHITFGDNSKEKFIDNIGKNHFFIINNGLLVEGLKHNLSSISQLCDKRYVRIGRELKSLVIYNVFFYGNILLLFYNNLNKNIKN